MLQETILAILASFVISAALYPVVIPLLRRLKFGQQIREEGPQEHLKKAGTPTMGAVVFLFSTFLVSLFFVWKYPEMIPLLIAMAGFGVVGLLDDWLKIRRQHSEGLTPNQKLLGQLIVSAVLCWYFLSVVPDGTMMKIPFTSIEVTLPWYIFIPFFLFVMLATDNAVNLTDGLDGLSSSVTSVVALFFAVVALGEENGLAPLAGAVAGGLLGYLLYNTYPAKVFMGDTGSLALGGFVAASAFALHNPFIILLVGFVYVVEECSVFLQVACYRITKGKRLFKMAPIHHHFELSGWSETRVVTVFTVVTLMMCLIAYMGV